MRFLMLQQPLSWSRLISQPYLRHLRLDLSLLGPFGASLFVEPSKEPSKSFLCRLLGRRLRGAFRANAATNRLGVWWPCWPMARVRARGVIWTTSGIAFLVGGCVLKKIVGVQGFFGKISRQEKKSSAGFQSPYTKLFIWDWARSAIQIPTLMFWLSNLDPPMMRRSLLRTFSSFMMFLDLMKISSLDIDMASLSRSSL